MNEKILEQLENVPFNGADAFKKLTELCNSYANLDGINKEEKERLNYELSLIKKWGIAKVFLFGYDLCLNEGFGTTYMMEGNSYVNYLLGISTVNPVKYNLPFERFFNEYRKFLPAYSFYVEKGRRGKLLKSIYEKFGKSKVIKGVDNACIYYVSNNAINPELIKETVIVANIGEEAYEENISFLTCKELEKLGYYSFSVIEVKDIKYAIEECFTEQDIYEKAKELFGYTISETQAFTDIEEIKEILVNTEYKLIYQEQLMEILNKICGVCLAMADHLRREIAKRKKESLKDLQKNLLEKYGDKGQKLFDYLYENGRYTVSKAYVITCLHNLIEFGEENGRL